MPENQLDLSRSQTRDCVGGHVTLTKTATTSSGSSLPVTHRDRLQFAQQCGEMHPNSPQKGVWVISSQSQSLGGCLNLKLALSTCDPM